MGAGSAAHRSAKGYALRCVQGTAPSPAPAMAGVLRQIAVGGLFADVVLFVVAVAFGGVERNFGGAARALVAPVVVGNGRDGFVERLCHASSPLSWRANAGRDNVVPKGTALQLLARRRLTLALAGLLPGAVAAVGAAGDGAEHAVMA